MPKPITEVTLQDCIYEMQIEGINNKTLNMLEDFVDKTIREQYNKGYNDGLNSRKE